MSWADMSQEDAAEGDAVSGTAGYVATPEETAAAATDPNLAVPVDPELAATSTAPVPAPATLLP
jgi:hypothetical protein